MPVFEYTATDNRGMTTCDTIVAQNRKAALDELFDRGLCPASIAEKKQAQVQSGRFSGRVTRSDVEQFTRELGNLLNAGMSLSKAIKILSRESSKPASQKLWSDIHDSVANGMSLADAMQQFPKLFSSVYIAMVQAGETGGFLELVLGHIADFRSRELELKNRVQAALIYPVILVGLACLIMLFLLIYFIPRFSTIFADFGGTLPPLTRGIVTVSQGLLDHWLFIAAAITLVIISVKSFLNRPDGKLTLEKWMLQIPVIGSITSRFAFVRFARMLGTLLNAGVPLITALKVAKEAIGNRTLSNTVEEAVEKVRKGMSLSQGLRECPSLFSGSNIEMIAVAEESSRLGEELARLAEYNEKELDRHLKTAVSFAEPIMLFIMAALVGTIVIGMLLPIFNLQELIH